MKEKSDEPAKQPPDTGQPEAQEQPEYRAVSQEELKQILEAHRQWLESDGKEGKQADLSGANLKRANLWEANLQEADLGGANLQEVFLTKANLQKANLWEANLQEADLGGADLQKAYLPRANLQGANLGDTNLKDADLTGADLQGADLTEVKGLSEATLQNANFDEVTGLLGSEFARADVTGTKLPEDIRDFKVLQVVEETSKNARKIFLSMLLGCAYSWLTIATTTDVNLLTNTAASPLPIIGTNIPIAWFYVAAPLILMLLYVYFHFYLQRLWEGLAGLPAIFPDGKRLDQRAYPWLLNGLVRRHFDRLQDARTTFGKLEELVTIFLAWWVVPVTLLAFWMRYLPRHEWWGTAFHIVLLTAAIWGAMVLYRIATSTLRGESRSAFVSAGTWLMPFVAVGITLLSLSAIENSRGFITSYVGYNTFAELREAEVSTKPSDYYKLTAQQKRESVKGANLRDRDLRGADAFKGFLINADLKGANLQGANLGFAKLQGADLSAAKLQGANLLGAQLQEANFNEANLQKATLGFANLQGANLGFAKLQGADLSAAKLQGANLGFAKLQGAKLFVAHLQGANLREVEVVTAFQIKQARKWQLAIYSGDLLKELGLPANHNATVEKKLAEMEKEKGKTAKSP